MVRRSVWPKHHFIFRQVPSVIDKEIVPKMQSLPSAVKAMFVKRFEKDEPLLQNIRYNDQFAYVNRDNNIVGYSPSVQDVMAIDWQIYE